MQVELKQIQGEVGITFVYVTHDQEEALTMSDRIAVFNEGRIEQVGTPAEVYEEPSSRVRLRLRRRLERDRARRPELHGPPREGPAARARATPPRASRPRRARIRDVAYAGMITRYLVVLDAGGELQVVRQNLETSSAQALEQVGTRGGRRLAARTHDRGLVRDRERRQVMRQNAGNPAKVAWLVIAGLLAFMAAFAIGCGSSDSGSSNRQRRTCRPRSARARASST